MRVSGMWAREGPRIHSRFHLLTSAFYLTHSATEPRKRRPSAPNRCPCVRIPPSGVRAFPLQAHRRSLQTNVTDGATTTFTERFQIQRTFIKPQRGHFRSEIRGGNTWHRTKRRQRANGKAFSGERRRFPTRLGGAGVGHRTTHPLARQRQPHRFRGSTSRQRPESNRRCPSGCTQSSFGSLASPFPRERTPLPRPPSRKSARPPSALLCSTQCHKNLHHSEPHSPSGGPSPAHCGRTRRSFGVCAPRIPWKKTSARTRMEIPPHFRKTIPGPRTPHFFLSPCNGSFPSVPRLASRRLLPTFWKPWASDPGRRETRNSVSRGYSPLPGVPRGGVAFCRPKHTGGRASPWTG